MRDWSRPNVSFHHVPGHKRLNRHIAYGRTNLGPGNETLISDHRLERPVVTEQVHEPAEVLIVDCVEVSLDAQGRSPFVLRPEDRRTLQMCQVRPRFGLRTPDGPSDSLCADDQRRPDAVLDQGEIVQRRESRHRLAAADVHPDRAAVVLKDVRDRLAGLVVVQIASAKHQTRSYAE